jgi:hypothetical protein
MAADGEFITRLQAAFDDADAIDANAICAAEVTNHQETLNLSDAAVPARYFARIDLDVAFGMAAKQ